MPERLENHQRQVTFNGIEPTGLKKTLGTLEVRRTAERVRDDAVVRRQRTLETIAWSTERWGRFGYGTTAMPLLKRLEDLSRRQR